MTASASSARPMSTRAAAASARSRGATVESASASCSRSGPFCVVFQSWMLSELGLAQAAAVARRPQIAEGRTLRAQRRRAATRRFSPTENGRAARISPYRSDVSHARIAASRHCADCATGRSPRTLLVRNRSANVAGLMSVRIVRRQATLVALVALAAGRRGPAVAAPLDDPFVGGLGFNGPTAANLGAVYWNPAALGLVRGVQIMVAGTTRVSTTTVRRTGVDAAGLPDLSLPPTADRDRARRDPTACSGRPGRARSWPSAPTSAATGSRSGFATYEPLRRAEPLLDERRRHRADALPPHRRRPAQPGAGAGAVDPLRQRLPHRRRARVSVLDRATHLRRADHARQRRESGQRRALRPGLGAVDRRRALLGHAGRRHLLAAQDRRVRARLLEPARSAPTSAASRSPPTRPR